MSNAYKCDRCEELFEGKPAGIYRSPNPFRQGLEDTEQRSFNLCDGCNKQLTKFMNGRSLRFHIPEIDDRTISFDVDIGPEDRSSGWEHPIHSYCIEPPQDTETVLKDMREHNGRNY